MKTIKTNGYTLYLTDKEMRYRIVEPFNGSFIIEKLIQKVVHNYSFLWINKKIDFKWISIDKIGNEISCFIKPRHVYYDSKQEAIDAIYDFEKYPIYH